MSLQAINFDLKITPGSIPPVLHMSQYDSGRQYTAYLKDEENTAFIPGAGATAKLKGFNAAGVPWEQAATVDGSTVVFTPSGAATDQFGIMPVTIEITAGGEKLTPLLMIFDIQRAGYTNEQAVRSSEFETAMEAAVAEALTEVGILLAEDQATKTAAMTQPVGVDANGKLWTTPGGGGLSDDAKQRLLACFAHVAWTDEHGQDYYDALEDALYPPADLVSITAVYLQDRPIYDTDDLDAIKAGDDLTVTANYSDSTSVVLDDEDYTLSGTLTAGTSVITVSYGGKTATFNVAVTHKIIKYSYKFSEGDLIKKNASTSWDATHGIFLGESEITKRNRRSFVTDSGIVPMKTTTDDQTYTETEYYPIEIPQDATGLTIAITPSTQYIGPALYAFANGAYTRVLDPGWQLGSYTLNFTAGQYQYLTVPSKQNASGSNYGTEPTELEITFTKT